MGTNVTRRTNDALLAVCVFIFLAAAYFFTTTSNMQLTSDEGVNLALVESIAKFGRFDVEQMATLTREVRPEFGLDGLHYSKYGLAQGVLSVPLYWLVQAVAKIGVIPTLLLFNALVTAACGAFVYLLARRLGYGPGLGLALALVYGLASPAWVYTKRYMSEPVTSLALLTTAYGCVRAARGSRGWAIAAGLCFGVGVLNKAANAAFAPAFVLYLLLAGGPESAWRQRLVWRPGWWRALGFLVPVGIAGLAFVYYNWARFGVPLQTGYGTNEGFNVPIYEGLAGLLFSPGKSAFIYFPLLLLLFFWTPVFLRRRRAEGLFFLALVVGHVLLYATWWIWWGGWNWGVRFLVPAWSFAVLLLAEGLRGLRRPRGFAVGQGVAFVALAVVSFAVQALGVAVDHTVYLASLLPLSQDPDRLTLTDPSRQPVLNQLRYLNPGSLDFGWLVPGQAVTPDGTVLGWLTAGVVAALIALALAYVWRGRGAIPALGLIVACVVVLLGTRTYLERTSAREDGSARQIVAQLREEASANAYLLYLAPRYTTLWVNAATLPLPTWGQYEEENPKPSTLQRLESLAATSDEVWVVSEYPPAARESGIERWLAAHAFRQSERWYGPFRLAGYRTGKGGSGG
ncbi:MAG: ArnT family glycosyltransferase, partial [Chloroflexota bacterium]